MAPRTRRTTCSPAEKRWRPRSTRGTVCGYRFRNTVCAGKGAHHCKPRADRVVAFFAELLVHTKGRWARRAFRLEDWQEHEIIRPLFGEVVWSTEWRCYVRRYRIAYIVLGRKNGKALALDTPIPTPGGWTTQGNLHAGDVVLDDAGQPTRVVAVGPVESDRPCYQLVFADGSHIVADAEHEWITRARRGGVAQRTTAEIAASLFCGKERNHDIGIGGSLDLPEADLPLDPYVLGAWLGDGTTLQGDITTADPEVVAGIEAAGFRTVRRPAYSPYGYGVYGLKTKLRDNVGVLGNKHIPTAYLRASEKQRLALLQGLMDTDGYVSPAGQCEFTSTLRPLAEGVVELVRSLGMKATCAEKRASLNGRDCGPKWRVQFWAYADMPVFRIERKLVRQKARPGSPSRASTRKIVAVEPVDSVPVRCIQVESPFGMYLAGPGMVPTHNSELAAGITLYLMVGDDEESAEVYGAAKDTKQARKVWEPAERMRALSPTLRDRLGVNKNERRIFDLKTGSYYEIITSDAEGELGHNPHGFVLDELLSQSDDGLFNAMRTAMGTRTQPLMLVITTETNDPAGFAAHQIDEAERIQADPSRTPHVFAYVRKTPMEADPWNEANWAHANPALGSFLSKEALRQEAMEAKGDPTKENSFRQFRLNQRVQQVTRWMPLHIWDASAGMVDPAKLSGRTCFAGLDLASTTDLAAWALLFPGENGEPHEVVWRFYTPEAQVPFLDRHTAGQASVWVRQGLLVATPGDWIDYDTIHRQIEADKVRYRLVQVGYDQKEATATAQFMQGLGLSIEPVAQGFALSGALKELMRLTKADLLRNGGHPVARWNADSAEVRQDDQERIKVVKPDRKKSGKRIDGIAALANAIQVWQAWAAEEPKAVNLW